MRIPKLNKSIDTDQSRSDEIFSCLFCSHQVKNTSLNRYENHLVQRHNLEKHIQQTILDTFNGKRRNMEKKNEEMFSMKYVKDAMDSIEKINKEKSKGMLKKSLKEKGEDPFKDLLDFVEETEKDMICDKNSRNIEVKAEKSCNTIGDVGQSDELSSSSNVESVHYKCEKCAKTFDRAAKLNFHMKNNHTVDSRNAINSADNEKVDKNKQETSTDKELKINDSEWTEFLIFDCKVCLTKMPSSMYPDHLLTWHSLTLADYKKKTGENGNCFPAEYQCLVCINKVPWKKASLIDHLMTHKLTPDQYKVIFEKAIEKQIDKQTEMLKKVGDSPASEKPMTELGDTNHEKKNEDTYSTEKRIECKSCQKQFSTNFKLQRHIKSDHCDQFQESGMKSPNPETIDKEIKGESCESEVAKKKFNCQICREEFLWSDSKIKEHLSQKHCITMDFYFTLYEKNYGSKSDEKLKESSEENFSCNICSFSSSRKMALTNHTKKYHEQVEEVECCKENLSTKWEVFVHLMENHKDKNKEMFNKFQVWPGLEKYYIAK